jgi:hypothetical protein
MPWDSNLINGHVYKENTHWDVMRKVHCNSSVSISHSCFRVEYLGELVPVILYLEKIIKTKNNKGCKHKWKCLVVKEYAPEPKCALIFPLDFFSFKQEFLFAYLHSGPYKKAAKGKCAQDQRPKVDKNERFIGGHEEYHSDNCKERHECDQSEHL